MEKLLKRYRIIRLLGKGGFGEVYLALDEQSNNRPVAVKKVRIDSPECRVSIENEITLRTHARHFDFIPEIYDVVFENIGWQREVYIVMQYIEGEPLDPSSSQWTPDAVIEFLQTMLRHLALLHKHSIIHRDLKPSNILRTPGGRYCIVDFGIAKTGYATRTLLVGLGTRLYIAPEQAHCLRTTSRSDLYGVGIIAYVLLTNRVLPSDQIRCDGFGTVAESLRRPSKLVPDVPPALDRTIMRLIQRDPVKRPANAEEALSMLDGRNGIRQARLELMVFALAAILAFTIPLAGILPIGLFISSLFLSPLIGVSQSALFQQRWKISLFMYYVLFHISALASYMAGYEFVTDIILFTNFWSGCLLAFLNLAFRIVKLVCK